MLNSNIAVDSLPTLQISLGIKRYLKRFMLGRYLVADSYRRLKHREDVQYHYFSSVNDVKSVTQPDTVPLMENNY